MGNEEKGDKDLPFGLVINVHPNQYEIFDHRINKPIYYQKKEGEEITGSMVLQEMDKVVFSKRKNIKIDYFTPNNVALLLSISSKSLYDSHNIFKNYLNPHIIRKGESDKKHFLIEQSKIVCDYIEKVQISLVFGYTAVETFANISIPENYEYEFIDNKGIKQIYNKEAIERWLSLKEKISKILPDIYNTEKIEENKFWSDFLKLEEYRNNIIHQKSIKRIEFIKPYFKPHIEKVCKSGIKVLEFFYKNQVEKDITNPLWPWLINPQKEFPVSPNFDSEKFEVIGNVYEGIKK